MQTRFVLGLLSLSLLAAAPQQKPPKYQIDEVRATGCVRRAEGSRCLLLHTLDGTTTYTFTASPEPELGSVITISAKAHAGRATCKEGIPVDLIDWQPTEAKCEETPKK
jgi:hypothetical protein